MVRRTCSSGLKLLPTRSRPVHSAFPFASTSSMGMSNPLRSMNPCHRSARSAPLCARTKEPAQPIMEISSPTTIDTLIASPPRRTVRLTNATFGKFGNFGGRAIVQDAWVGWAPTGITGGTVVYIDGGLLLIPISRHLLESTTNFVTADVQGDAFRFPGSPFPAFRDVGVQVRGWALDKKIGFRGGVYEGYAPVTQPAGSCGTGGVGCITPKRNPAFGGFVNFDIVGSEE